MLQPPPYLHRFSGNGAYPGENSYCSLLRNVWPEAFLCKNDQNQSPGRYCGVIPYPTAEQLADIACICVERARRTVQMLNPKVALLSYSTKGSGSGETVDTVRQAVEILKERNVDFDFDGELQADAALVPEVGEHKAPGSKVAGHANVLIFPNLDAANIGYKMVQRFANATALGPLVQGLAKPILDLSRGCSTEDIADVVAVCCSDAISTDIMEKEAANA